MEAADVHRATGAIDPKNVGRKKIKIQRIEDDRNRQVSSIETATVEGDFKSLRTDVTSSSADTADFLIWRCR